MNIGNLTIEEIIKFAEMDIEYADKLNSKPDNLTEEQARDMLAIIRWWIPMILNSAKYELTETK